MQTGFEHTDHDDPFTLVFVYRLDNDSGIYNNRVTRNNSLQIGRGASEGDYSVRILNNVRLGNSGSRVEDVYTDRFVIHSYSYSGSANGTHTHWIDGELQGTTDFLQEIGRLPLGESGSGHYTQGTISEVLIFSEALDPMQVDAVTIQLADIHGIYVPNATWIQAFTPSEQAIIHASRYTRSQFEARKAIQDASTEINISDTLITGVAAWYRQEELIQHEEGDAVGVWPDAFGQWPLENASGNTALSPTFRANSLNGFSGLDFDNVDDRLNGTYNHPYNSDSPITVVAVYAQKSIDGNNRILTNDRNNFQFAGRYETNAYRALGAGDWLDEGEVYIPFVEGKPVIQAYRYDAATGLQESWINDVLIGSHTEQFQIGKIGLGEVISNQEANAYIYELIIFDRLVPDTELDIVEVYFAEKYGLYHPDADWVQGFDVSEQAIIGRSAYSQVEFEARKSLQDASIALASIFNIPDAMIDGVVAWHRPEDLSIYENGASVAFWPDAFGQWPLEYTGGNPAIAPTYQHDVSNGIAALDFDNTDDRLYGTYNHLMSDAHPITVIAVYAQKSINGSNRVLANDRNSFMIAGRYETNGYRAWGAGDWLDDSEQVIPFMANQPVVHSYRYDALTGFQESWLDGSFIGSHTEKFEMGRIGMGEVIANQEANAYIHELIIFDRYLSDTEMDAVEVYFANKYDLVHPSATDRQILIFDLNLEAQLRAAIGVVAPGPIMQSHLNGLTGDFDFSGLGISDLRGIEQLTGITSLNLNGNRLDADFDSDDMAQVQVLLDAGVTVTTDSQETLSIATAVSNPSGGSILITPLKTDYFYGDAVEVVFDLAPGYTFEGWTGDLSGTDHSHAITLEGNVSVSATVSDLGLDLTNLAAWYRPEELSEIGIDPGDEVTTWPDALGNFDLTAPADSRSLVIGAEETLAGYRGLFFENDHDRLNGTFAHASGADSLTVTVVYSIYRKNGGFGNRIVWSDGAQNNLNMGRSDGSSDYNIGISNNENWLQNTGVDRDGDPVRVPYHDDAYVIQTYRYYGSTFTHDHRLNGLEMFDITETQAAHFSTIGLGVEGSTREAAGTVMELIIHDTALSDTRLDDIEAYLADKYGLYHPVADWKTAYPAEQQVIIDDSQYGQEAAEQVFAIQAAYPEVTNSIISNLAAWYRPETLTAQGLLDGAFVDAWPDALGQFDLLALGGGGRIPVFATGLLAGYDGLHLVDNYDHLDNTYRHPSAEDPLTISVVYAIHTSNGSNRNRVVWSDGPQHLNMGRSDGSSGYNIGYQGQDQWTSNAGVDRQGNAIQTPFYEDRFVIQTYRYDPSEIDPSHTHRLNGLFMGFFTGSSHYATIDMGLDGTTGKARAYVMEMLIHDAALSDADLNAVEVYLANKYALYHPDAAWLDVYDAEQRAIIDRSQYTAAQAGSLASLQTTDPAIPDAALSDLAAWYRPEDLSAQGLSEGQQVFVWPDALGRFDLLDASDSASRPEFASNLINGLDGLDLKDGKDRLKGEWVHPGSDIPLTVTAVYAIHSHPIGMR
ncbi:MAG: hypothetical protein HRU10_14940 [Opitutales bacterium]|nr:hypothetical protein [Opitutales bacterium]